VLVRGLLLAAAAACSAILVGCVAGAVDPEAAAPEDTKERVGATQQAGTLEKDPSPQLGHNYAAGSASGSSSGAGGGASGETITAPASPQDAKDDGEGTGNGTGDGSGPQPDPWIPQAAIGSPLPGTSK
jgi:hypothetical protein